MWESCTWYGKIIFKENDMQRVLGKVYKLNGHIY